MDFPEFRDVLDAQRQIRPYLAPTPLHVYPALNALIGARSTSNRRTTSPSARSKCVAASTCSPA